MSAGNLGLNNAVNELVVSFKFELGTNVRIENGGWFAGIICRDIRRFVQIWRAAILVNSFILLTGTSV